MIDTYELCGFTLRTGDLICTQDGNQHVLFTKAYELLGHAIPGPVDHIAIYVGPGPRCIEAGPFGVRDFDLRGGRWDADAMFPRRLIADSLYGIADPTYGRDLPDGEERARADAAAYCLEQLDAGRPYNVNFFNSTTEDAFYCSQLVYMAYLRVGIDLNSGSGVPDLPGAGSIIFPTEIWNACRQIRII
jgi:Permuted papain-like amidase enzyme, YaeF/YiiX, C92 family